METLDTVHTHTHTHTEDLLENKKRNSSIDLLKICAIFLIVVSHCIPWWDYGNMSGIIDIRNATNNYKELIVIIIRYLGQIGNCIFIVCSAYFLMDSKKINKNKILYMVTDTFTISIIIMISSIFSGFKLSFKEMVKCIFPITFSNNWFIGCYILFYIIHPVLNKFINSLNKKQLLEINMFLILYFCVWQFIKTSIYTRIMGFVVIYFIVAYLKKYMNNYRKNIKKNIFMLIISILGLIVSLIMFNILGLMISIFHDKMQYMAQIINPFIIIIAVSVFNLFCNKNFFNSKINYIANITLLIYLIHDNILIRNYLKPYYFNRIFDTIGYNNIVLVVVLTAIIVFILSIILAAIYKETIQKIQKKISDYIYEHANIIITNWVNLLLKVD